MITGLRGVTRRASSVRHWRPDMRNAGFTIIELLVILGVIAILLLMAIPSYQHKLVRDQVVEALTLADIAKKPIAQAWGSSAKLPADNAAAGLPVAEKVMPAWNRLATHIRKLDPTRIVDFHYGYCLFAGVQMGVFDRENYMTFNHHPYGNLVADVAREKRRVGFDDSVPVLIGEIFNFNSKFT